MKKLQRIARDTAQSLQKKVDFTSFGEDSEIDKTVLDVITDPLVHLVRNAVDHGVEDCDLRIKAGKPERASVKVKAYQSGDNLAIEVEDDGRGLDKEKLIAKARSEGLLSDKVQLSDEEAFALVFRPGLSTKESVTEFSGRGVGMDVVKTYIERVKGRIDLTSTPGQGTRVRILLPLTLAIIDGLVVSLGSQRYVIPLSIVTETMRPQMESSDDRLGLGEILDVRGNTVPLYRLNSLLNQAPCTRRIDESIAILVDLGKKNTVAILVDDVVGRQQIVIKRLGSELKNQRGLSGAAVLGDGKVALILDVSSLFAKNQTKKAA